MEDQRPVVIVGGGISGLAAAHQVRKQAPHLPLLVIEAQDRLGGIIETVRSDGFIVEGGPDSFLASKPEGVRLCDELGLGGQLIGPDPERRRTLVWHAGELYPIPQGLSGLVPADLEAFTSSSLFSTEGKARIWRELSIPPQAGDEDETLANFIRRRFGSEAYHRLIEPLMAGIYGGDGELLSLAATFPHLRALERDHSGIVRGLMAEAERSRPATRTGFLTPDTGMQTIVDALVQELPPASIMTGVRVTRITVGRAGIRLELDRSDAIDVRAAIVATPAYAAASLIGHLDTRLNAALHSIPYATSATVTLAFRDEDLSRPLDGYGYIVPQAAERRVLASTWVSSKFPGRAPPGYALIRTFFGRYGESLDALSDDHLVSAACTELFGTLGISVPPRRHWEFWRREAMPQYLLGHLDRLQEIDTVLAGFPGLYLASALRGVGIPDCIRSGERAAADAIAYATG